MIRASLDPLAVMQNIPASLIIRLNLFLREAYHDTNQLIKETISNIGI